MASYFRPIEGVLQADILEASRRIKEKSDTADNESVGQFGSALNQWQRPITEFGCDPHWVVNLKRSPYIGEIDFGRKEWARSREAVDAVMELLLKEMRAKASTEYEHLRIDSYVRQGSSRDGLKVIQPDEFDTVLEFHIEGLQLSEQPIYKNRKRVPGLCYLQVDTSRYDLESRFPKLYRESVFEERNGNVYLNPRMIHQGVFQSLIDKSCRSIEEIVDNMKRFGKVNFHITRKMNPPAVNITIHLDDDDANFLYTREGHIRDRSESVREIDLDIIPAIRFRVDGNTRFNGRPVNVVIHAVCKWKEEDSAKSLEIADQLLVWHISSAGYERYILDVARSDPKQIFILTALRLLKTYFSKTKTIAKSENRPPPPITTVLQSYHLKQITFYVILYVCHVCPNIKIDGVERALDFLFNLIRVSLQKKHLPHFFYSNSGIGHMLEDYPSFSNALRFDLYRKIPNESLKQAELSYENHLLKDFGYGNVDEDHEMTTMISKFSDEFVRGEYF